MSSAGQLCDINGVCVDFPSDETFRITTDEGNLWVSREKSDNSSHVPESSTLIYDQEPVKIFEAILPLYLNSTLLRSLSEANASELSCRMNAMKSASDNARALGESLSLIYNRRRQTQITNQIIEIVSGAGAV